MSVFCRLFKLYSSAPLSSPRLLDVIFRARARGCGCFYLDLRADTNSCDSQMSRDGCYEVRLK